MIFKVTSNTNHEAPQWPAQGVGHPDQRWGFGHPGVTVQERKCVWKEKGCCKIREKRKKDAVKLFVIRHTMHCSMGLVRGVQLLEHLLSME